MKSRWEHRSSGDLAGLQSLSNQLHIPTPIARVLVNRGLSDLASIRNFLKSSTGNLHNPFLMKDMERAVDRLINALREREKIVIFGDYDVDGITSVALLYLFLKDLGGNVSFYIPDRTSEGYGISHIGIDEAKERNASLILTVDCGVTSVDEVRYAADLGIEVIVTDHHEPGESLPEASAVLDPKRPDCNYPFKHLAGCGVAYKLAQGLLKRLELPEDYIEKYIDLVAIGSAADIVPLIDENRIFVKFGLERVNSGGIDGLGTLIETAGLQVGQIDVGKIIFGIAPRINAVGRMGHANPAVELLVTKNHLRACQIASLLEEENRRRKEIDTRTFDEAIAQIEFDYHPDEDWVIVLSGEGWHPGVIGIVASRIIERYYRPTVMISVDNGIGKGSARSIPNFDLHAALKSCSDLFQQFGGHKYAAGFTLDSKLIAEFKRRFNDIAHQMLNEEDLIPRIVIDDEITLSEINSELARMLALLEPFGSGNPQPLFVAYGLTIVGEPHIVGNNHLKFRVAQNGTTLDAIAFKRGDELTQLKMQRTVDLVFAIEENLWMNRRSLQLKVIDLH